jgi:hypothetical protein
MSSLSPKPAHSRNGQHVQDACYTGIRINGDVARRAKELARESGTSFSGLIEYLLERQLQTA